MLRRAKAEEEGLLSAIPEGGPNEPNIGSPSGIFLIFHKDLQASLLSLLQIKKPRYCVATNTWFSGGRGIRTPGTRKRTPVFKTGAFNQLCHSSSWIANIDYSQVIE